MTRPKLNYDNLGDLLWYASEIEAKVARPAPARGRYGWYQIVNRDTGEVMELRRATTLADKADDKRNLIDWKSRKAVEGVVRDTDLIAEIAQIEIDPQGRDDKDRLAELIDQAVAASGGATGSTAGTAMHSIFEADDLGLDPRPPAPYMGDVLARRATIEAAGLVTDRAWIEPIVVNEELNVAGMADRFKLDPRGAFRTAEDAGTYVVFDDKTGASLHPLSFAAQLGIYAHGSYIYDPVTFERLPLPPLDRTVGIICHTPAGTNRSTLYAVDIAAGYELLRHLVEVESSRLSWQVGYTMGAPKEVPEAVAEASAALAAAAVVDGNGQGHVDLDTMATVEAQVAATKPSGAALVEAVFPGAVEVGAEDPFAGLPDEDGRLQPDRVKKRRWLEGRIATLKTTEAGAQALVAHWPAEIPPFKQGDREGHDYTAAELEAINGALWGAEGAATVPFPETVDPTDRTAVRVAGDDPRVLGLRDRFAALPPDLRGQVQARQAEHKIPRLTSGGATEAQVDQAESFIRAAEEVFAPRAQRITETLNVLADHGVSEAVALAAVGVASPFELHGKAEERLRLLKGAALLGWIVERDGALVVDQPAQVLDLYQNSRQDLWRAAKAEAKAHGLTPPASSDAALADPILVACIGAA